MRAREFNVEKWTKNIRNLLTALIQKALARRRIVQAEKRNEIPNIKR